jgi:hypothetical protein
VENVDATPLGTLRSRSTGPLDRPNLEIPMHVAAVSRLRDVACPGKPGELTIALCRMQRAARLQGVSR